MTVRPRYRRLDDRQFLQLLRLASGLLQTTDGDLESALSLAIRLHSDLLTGIRERGVRSDLGPGDAILFVPDTGGLAIRTERHKPRPNPEDAPTEEAEYPDIDLLGFEVIESTGDHRSSHDLDAGVDEESWFD